MRGRSRSAERRPSGRGAAPGARRPGRRTSGRRAPSPRGSRPSAPQDHARADVDVDARAADRAGAQPHRSRRSAGAATSRKRPLRLLRVASTRTNLRVPVRARLRDHARPGQLPEEQAAQLERLAELDRPRARARGSACPGCTGARGSPRRAGRCAPSPTASVNCGKRATQSVEPVTPDRTEVCTLTVCAAQPPKLQFSQTTSRRREQRLARLLDEQVRVHEPSVAAAARDLSARGSVIRAPPSTWIPSWWKSRRLGETADAAAADDQVVDALGDLDPVAGALDDHELADAARCSPGAGGRRPRAHRGPIFTSHEVEVDLLPAGPGVVGPHLRAARGRARRRRAGHDHFAATAGRTRRRSSSRSSGPAADHQKKTA